MKPIFSNAISVIEAGRISTIPPRSFRRVVGLGSAVAWPVVARAQQPAVPVIGWLSGRNSETDAHVLPAFRRALNRQGYVEGRNVTIEYRWSDTQHDRLPALAADSTAGQGERMRLWAKREKQIRSVVESTAGLYGDLQGIAGRSLLEIDGLDLPLLDGPVAGEAAE